MNPTRPSDHDIRQGMMVLCKQGILRGFVESAQSDHIQVRLNASGEQVWLPVSSVQEVEDDVRLLWSKQELWTRACSSKPIAG
ncbi:DUF2171 domain-containing protein [Deinococcus misasensis]|uniref:DUF2171 domain-containing protein n=1 Tax=Deinococcus misasensis TaxID=392413 RepID=UPI000AB78511|nr:DUF2171 domain-containing protein [Deinococcus misasensis]